MKKGYQDKIKAALVAGEHLLEKAQNEPFHFLVFWFSSCSGKSL